MDNYPNTKLECLKLAYTVPNLTPEQVVSRAGAYYDFIYPPTPEVPVAEDNTGQEDANQS